MNDEGQFEIEYYAVSHIGKVRSNHEDNFLLPSGEHIANNVVLNGKSRGKVEYSGSLPCTESAVMFTVADGMGGHMAGEVASMTAVDMLSFLNGKTLSGGVSGAVAKLKELIVDINAAVFNKGKQNPDCRNMGSTLATLVVNSSGIAAVNVGDSRIYRYSGNRLTKISKDHTDGQRLIDIGIISGEDDELYKSNGALTRFLGMQNESREDICFVSEVFGVSDSDVYIVCSDGLSNFVPHALMEKIISESGADVSALGNRLLENALSNPESPKAGSDNITITVVSLKLAANKKAQKNKSLFNIFRRK